MQERGGALVETAHIVGQLSPVPGRMGRVCTFFEMSPAPAPPPSVASSCARIRTTRLRSAQRLPKPKRQDTCAAIPPTGSAFVRRVGGENPWLWYRVDGDEVALATLTISPPVPVDP